MSENKTDAFDNARALLEGGSAISEDYYRRLFSVVRAALSAIDGTAPSDTVEPESLEAFADLVEGAYLYDGADDEAGFHRGACWALARIMGDVGSGAAPSLSEGEDVLDAVLAEMREKAARRLPADKHAEKREALWKKWDPMFFGVGMPLTRNPEIDALCYRYGIFGYAEKASEDAPEPSPLLWFEQFPVAESQSYAKKIKRRAKKSSKFARKHAKLVKRYADIAPLYKGATFVPDYEKAYQFEKERKEACFDVRETWGLDHALPMMLYSRICAYKQVTIGYPDEIAADKAAFEEELLLPMLASLEFQVVAGSGEAFESVLEKRCSEMTPDGQAAVKAVMDARVAEGYALLGRCLPFLWW